MGCTCMIVAAATRVEVVSVESRPLDRHASDELYGIALAAGLDADVTLSPAASPTMWSTPTSTAGSWATCAPTESW